MIIETIFSTLDEEGKPNFAPMGLVWGEGFITVRPFRNTRTYQNLTASGYGVANLSDDVLAYVKCGLYKEVLPSFPTKVVPGAVFESTCSWRETEVVSKDGSDDRAELKCRVLHKGWQKDFLGFCRAGNAVIEAAILATRLAIYDRKMVNEKLMYYMKVVDKTADSKEKQAFRLVQDYVEQWRAAFGAMMDKAARKRGEMESGWNGENLADLVRRCWVACEEYHREA